MKEEEFLYNYECSLPSLIKLNEELKFNFKNLTPDPNDLLMKENHCNLISIIGDDPEIQKKFTMLFLYKKFIDTSQKPEYDKIYLTYHKIDEYPIIILNYSISNDYSIQKNLSSYDNYSLFEKIQDYKISRNCIKNFINKNSFYIFFLIEENNNNKLDLNSFLDIYSQNNIYYFHYTKSTDYYEQLENILSKVFFLKKIENENYNYFIEKHITNYKNSNSIVFEHYFYLADKDFNCDNNKKVIENFIRMFKNNRKLNKTKAFYECFQENLKKFYASFFENKYYLKYDNNEFSLEGKGKKKIISENLIDIYSDQSSNFFYSIQSQENQIFFLEGNYDTIECEGKKEGEKKIIKFDVKYKKFENENVNNDDKILFNSLDCDKKMEYSIPNENYGIKDFDYIEEKRTYNNGIVKLEFETYA